MVALGRTCLIKPSNRELNGILSVTRRSRRDRTQHREILTGQVSACSDIGTRAKGANTGQMPFTPEDQVTARWLLQSSPGIHRGLQLRDVTAPKSIFPRADATRRAAGPTAFSD